jgi:hypothetical protein
MARDALPCNEFDDAVNQEPEPVPCIARRCEDCGAAFVSSLPGVTTCGVFKRCDGVG